jgi:preprotein translocase subunit YajC
MKKIIPFFFIFIFTITFSQEKKFENPKKIISKDSIDIKVDEEVIFSGGINPFRRKFYEIFDRDKVNGKGIVKSEATFIVTSAGIITDIKTTGMNDSMNKEMEQTIKEMSKMKWIPKKLNGKTVDSKYRLPITMTFVDE